MKATSSFSKVSAVQGALEAHPTSQDAITWSNNRKTTLLKCIAHLELYSGHVLFKGEPPIHYGTWPTSCAKCFSYVMRAGRALGIPTYRTKVLYIPQRPPLLPLTPRDFVSTVMSFSARKRQNRDSGLASEGLSDPWINRPLEVGSQFGVDPNLWDRNWAELSGGEGQRIMMAIGVSLGAAEVLLLDGELLPGFYFHPPPK